MAGQSDVACGGLDQTVVADLAADIAGLEARRDFAAERGRQRIALGARALADIEAVTGAEHGLALGGADAAVVLHFAAEQQGITTAISRRRGWVRGNARAAFHQHLARGIGKGRLRGATVKVQTTLAELGIGDAGRRCHQVAHIDLTAAAEDDAVAVDQHHRAVALDLPLDLARPGIRIVDPVEHRPVRLLVKFNRGVAPDVEGFPIENGLVGGLFDLHRGLAVGLGLLRALGILPTSGEAVIDFQTALAQAVRDKLHRAQRSGPTRRLSRLLRSNRGDRIVQGLDRALQLLVGFLLLCQWRRHTGQAASARSRGCTLLRGPLGGEPVRTERRCRLRITRHQTQRHRLGQRFEQPQRRLRGFTFERLDVGTTGWASEHHYEILLGCHTLVATQAAGVQKPAVTS